MLCPKCGKQINDDAVFCPFCGASVSEKKQDNNNQVSSKPKAAPAEKKGFTKGAIVASVGVLAIVCGFGIWMLFGRNTQRHNNVNTDVESSTQANAITVSSSSESYKTLMEIIDSAEAILSKSDDDYSNVNDENSDKTTPWQNRADIMSGTIPELENLKAQASQLQGLDSKVKSACDHYFEMAISSRKGMHEISTFCKDYFSINYDSPQSSSYSDVADYYSDLVSWYDNNKQVMDSITVPACVETEWNYYKKQFEINVEILNKVYKAVTYNDWLSYHSALNLETRFKKVEELGFDALLNAFKGEKSFSLNQRKVATKLADEIRTYCEMDDSSKGDYEFENDRDTKITTQFEAVSTIYPALYNTYDAFVILKTGCLSGTRDIVIEAEIPGLTQKYKQSYKLTSSYHRINIKPSALTGEINLSSAKDGQINISVYEKDGSTLINAQSFPVTIKSINDVEWFTDEFGVSTQDNILCFLTPDADAIDLLKRNAITEIYNITGGVQESMPGYQEVAPNHYVGTYIQAAGIMRALYDMGIRYDVSSFSISGSNQRVKLPKEVIEKKSGLCIETALTVASALQSAGMHAFLVFPPGHAQVAVEIWNDDYVDPDSGKAYIGEGHGEYFLIETVCLESDTNNDDIYRDYANALMERNPDDLPTNYPIAYYSADEWADYLKNCYVIDCNDSRLLGLTEFVH